MQMMTENLKLTLKESKKEFNFREWHANDSHGTHECHDPVASDEYRLFYLPGKLRGGNPELFLEAGGKI